MTKFNEICLKLAHWLGVAFLPVSAFFGDTFLLTWCFGAILVSRMLWVSDDVKTIKEVQCSQNSD